MARFRFDLYPIEKLKTKRIFKYIIRLVIIAVILNSFVVVVHLFDVIGYDLKEIGRRIDKVFFADVQTSGSMPVDSNGHITKTQSMYPGHSIPQDSIQDFLNRDAHPEQLSRLLASSGEIHDSNSVLGFYGIDVSHWQNSINWDQVHNDTLPSRLKFFIIKATQGLRTTDAYFKRNWTNARTDSSIVGAYHFYIYKDDPEKQAENFINTVSLSEGDMRPILDIELDCTGCTDPGIPQKELVADLKRYIETIEKHYGVKPILYTYSYFFNKYLKDEFAGYPYWIAKFSSYPPAGMSIYNYDTVLDSPFIALWQFSPSGRINGIVGNTDLSFMPGHFLDSLIIK